MPLQPPPLNAVGEVVPHDHEGIRADDGIIRRISELQVVDDKKIGRRRISSIALKPSTGPNGGVSVDFQRQIEEAGLDAKAFVTTPRWIGSIRFDASQLRAEKLKVGFDPLPDNPYHGEIWGSLTRPQLDKLFRSCHWFVPIENVSIWIG